jgi:Protein of unknown function (DUF3489)
MTKPRSKPKAATRATARKTAEPASRKQSAPVSSKPGARTKHDRIIAMLRTPAGVTIASLVTATEWQQLSVRGFLAGIVRKNVSEQGSGLSYQRWQASPSAADRARQAA